MVWVVFSDEKVFKSYSDRKKVLYRPKGERFNPDYVQFHRHSGRISCGVWGFITAGGVGELVEITSRMNSAEYISIINDIYEPAVDSIYGEQKHEFLLMQDNSAVHTSTATKHYFNTHPEIKLLQDWPPKSPDINPIENVWSTLTYNWDNDAMFNSREDILNATKNRWNNLIGESEYISKLYNSMPSRFAEIVENNGYPSSY